MMDNIPCLLLCTCKVITHVNAFYGAIKGLTLLVGSSDCMERLAASWYGYPADGIGALGLEHRWKPLTHPIYTISLFSLSQQQRQHKHCIFRINLEKLLITNYI